MTSCRTERCASLRDRLTAALDTLPTHDQAPANPERRGIHADGLPTPTRARATATGYGLGGEGLPRP